MNGTDELRASLPKITPDILDALEGEVPLIHLWARGPEWTQQAVDFSAMLYPELLAEIDRLRAENAKQIMCSECGFTWVSPSRGEDNCQRCDNTALKAKLERVQQFIDGHGDRVVGGKPGYVHHYDKCDHGQYGYENCADCTGEVLVQALAGEEGHE